MTITLDRPTLPILYSGDIVVIGGSFGGVAAALKLAQAGRKVALVEPRTYLGREMTATLRPWLRLPAGANSSPLPELIVACLEASGASAAPGEIPLHLEAIKRCLEDLLIAAGVKLIYASLPVGLGTTNGHLQGVIIGNKSGRQVLVCQTLIDTSETALIARLAGARFEPGSGELVHFSRTLEFDGVAPFDGNVLAVPPELGLADDQVIAHPGFHGQDSLLIELTLALPNGGSTPMEITRREVAARRKSMAVAAYLMAHGPAFQKAYLAAASHELHGPYTLPMADPVPDWARSLETLTLDVIQHSGDEFQVPLSALAGPVKGVWCLNEAARVSQPRDPVTASRLGEALASLLERHWEVTTAPSSARRVNLPQNTSPPDIPSAHPMQVREPTYPQRGRRYDLYPVRPASTPIVRTADVLVVGGGTSGATAAITAAQEGMHTVLVEMNPGLGGTGTYGGVHSYWFGRRVGFAAKVMTWVDQMHDYLQHRRPQGAIPKWNIEAKTEALIQAAEEAGVEMLLNALVIGVIVQENVVRGVVVASRAGPLALLAEVIIDASGDGDVAVSAGAEYVYGSERDHLVMWYSLAQFAKPGLTRNNFTSMVDVSNIEDYTRAILAGRRRGAKDQNHDHGIYVAPRESRHIKADVTLTLTDQLLRRCWPDVINIAFSNNDIKGHSSSDWMRMGLISPNLEIEIPYRVLLPQGLENILVVGKALSATHDALPAIRMQSDLENLGGVAALAAAMAVRSGKSPRAINVQALQEKLVHLDILPEPILSRTLRPKQYTATELETLIEALTADPPLYAYSDMEINEVFQNQIPLVEICCAGPQVIPLLEKALAQAEGPRQILLAQALAILGSTAGLPVLVSAIQDKLATGQLPEREAHIRHANHPPDQAAMPDVAYLIYSLGMAPDQGALPVWQRVVDLLASTTEADIRDRAKGIFYYVDAVCAGAERLGDPAAIPLLKQLHRYRPFRNQVSEQGFQPDFFLERQAYLELVIGRALARCGSPDGFIILINYLNDARALLAEHAHTELSAITGQDFGKDMAAWAQWLELEGENLKPIPWRKPADPVLAWNEVIYTVAQPESTCS